MARKLTIAREQVEMLAPWSRTAALLDWRQKYHEPDLAWHAKTETGHVLTIKSPRALSGAGREIDARGRGEDIGWAWHIHDLNDPDPLIQDYPWHSQASLTSHLKGGLIHAPEHGIDPRVYSGDYLPTFDAASEQAERAFLERFSGERRHPRAETPDYESIVNPRDDLDDDFGHIFGRLAASGHMFDWRPYDHPNGGVREAYRANLENGHYLIAHDPASSEGWSWGLFVPNGTYESRDGDVVPYDELANGGGASWRSMARWKPGRPHSTDVLPTFEHAKAQAEDYYRRAFPLGTDTSSGHRSRPDSGVDYERLVNPRDDLDEDYGDIFGGGR